MGPAWWGRSPGGRDTPRGLCRFPPLQELERLEVERVEMIRQHLCQYTQLRHETDMFNQSVSSPGRGQRGPWGAWGRGEPWPCAVVAGQGAATDESVWQVGTGSGLWVTSWDGHVSYPGCPRESIPSASHRCITIVKIAEDVLASPGEFLTMLELFKTSQADVPFDLFSGGKCGD